MKHNWHLASCDCFKFHKFKMKFKQYSLKDSLSLSGILELNLKE